VTFLLIWVLAMAAIGVFAYRRGWHETPYWIRQYIWCPVILEAIVWLPFLILPFTNIAKRDLSDSRTFEFFGFVYMVVVFLDTILVDVGIALGAVLLVVMLVDLLIPAKT
jgi:hypothetical protein